MFNQTFKSRKSLTFDNPIVVSFDKNDAVKVYQFGYDVNSKNIDLLITEQNVYWNTDIINTISTTSSNNNTTLSNLGYYFLSDEMRIYSNYKEQNISIRGSVETVKTQNGITKGDYLSLSFYNSNGEINFNNIDTNHHIYIHFNPEQEQQLPTDDVVVEDFKQFKKNDDVTITPVTLCGEIMLTDSYPTIGQDYYLILDSNEHDTTFLISDYETTFNPSNFDYASIILKEDNTPIATYYDKIKSDKIRFVISDNGRIISFTQFDKDENRFSDAKCYIYPITNKDNDSKVDVYFTIQSQNEETIENITNVTANF